MEPQSATVDLMKNQGHLEGRKRKEGSGERKRGKTGLVQNENLILTSQLPGDPVKAKTNTARHDYATEFVL